jgi:hypothetical protein
MRNRIISIGAGVVAAGLVMVASVAVSDRVSGLTDSGLFGICGPYGSDAWISVIAVLFLGAPILGLLVGALVANRIWRRRPLIVP